MKSPRFKVFIPIFVAASCHASTSPLPVDAESLFVRRVQPLLQEKCVSCHGKDEKFKGGLDLRTHGEMMFGGDSGQPAVEPGNPAASPLYLAVARTHEDWDPMPPKESERLSTEQKNWVSQWILGGAPWPDETEQKAIATANADRWEAEDGVIIATSGGLSESWTNRRYPPEAIWAYLPVPRPVPPSSAFASNPIDAFIADQLPSRLDPAPAADARTFIRRATFDLLGLPPTPSEVADFETESRRAPEGAIRSLIDRLLSSPHYGERMAQHWLDVTRYADSNGLANDYERGNSWRYRDYVVRSFNQDKAYNRFIREQIAGDEIDPDDPELLIATGFLRMGPWELTSMEVPKVARQRFLDDVTNSVGETFLAQSLQCARCHDHKFDPVPTRDYYGVQAVFATTQLTERHADFIPRENITGFEERFYLEKRRDEYIAALNRFDAQLLADAEQWFVDANKDPSRWRQAVTQAIAEASARTASPFFRHFNAARSILLKAKIPETEFPPPFVGFTPADFGNERVASKGLERLRWELERYEPVALAVYNGRTPEHRAVTRPLRVPDDRMTVGELEETRILPYGDPFAGQEVVAPGVLSALGIPPPAPIPNRIEGRRIAFADWVARADNPLTTRAIVNRVWLWHFGLPIAGNPNNFGSTGKNPTHPKLLDWLAATFVEQGWSFKRLHRLIMTSEAYRRSTQHPDSALLSQHDPTGTSYAVFQPRRLTAEELRDAMLKVTGELNPMLGGIPNRPEMNLEAALQPRQVMGTFASAWVPNPLPEQRHRRSLYTLKIRGLPDPAMEVFNRPTPDFSCEMRDASIVTPQVFSLFNGAASHARALAFAARLADETTTNEAAIRRAFALAFSRDPSTAELNACLAHWSDISALIARETPPTTTPPLRVQRDAVEENTGEKFSFMETLHAYEDFVPDLQPHEVPLRTRALADVCLALFNTAEFSYVY